jgi:hypothetical protein
MFYSPFEANVESGGETENTLDKLRLQTYQWAICTRTTDR